MTHLQMFKNAVQKALPRMEEDVEREMLARYKPLVPTDTYSEIMMSYQERKIQEDEIRLRNKPVKYPAKIQDEEMTTDAFNKWLPRSEIHDLCEEHIGQWLQVEPEEAKKLFGNGYFGRFMVDQWLRNMKLDLMVTEDAVKIIKLIKHLQLKNSKLDF